MRWAGDPRSFVGVLARPPPGAIILPAVVPGCGAGSFDRAECTRSSIFCMRPRRALIWCRESERGSALLPPPPVVEEVVDSAPPPPPAAVGVEEVVEPVLGRVEVRRVRVEEGGGRMEVEDL